MLRTVIAVTAITLLSSAAAFSQVLIGVKGSAQLANEKFSAAGVNISADNVVGFQAGLMLSAPISDQLSIRPQLLYSTKGFKFSNGALGGIAEAKVGINYLELPIQLAYSFEAGDGNLVVGAGPYAAYALNGKVTASANGQTTTESLDFGTSEAQTRFDYGLYLSAGYELSSGLGISLYYAPGLANLTNSTASAQATTKNTSYGISIGYFFGSRD